MGEKKDVQKQSLQEETETQLSEKPAEYRLYALLKKYNLTLAAAESLTGGMVCARIVGVPGVSEVFKEGFVTYSNKAKRRTLDVSKSTIRKEGAISEQTAKEMATGAAVMADADVAVSTTGNAGPSLAEDKELGLVYIGVYEGGKARAVEYHFQGSREEIRAQAAEAALLCAIAVIEKNHGKKSAKS